MARSSGSIGVRSSGVVPAAASAIKLLEDSEGRVARGALDERREVCVDDQQVGVGVADPGSGLAGEFVQRGQPHGQRQHDQHATGQPGGLHSGNQRPAGGGQDADVAAGPQAAALQNCS